MPHKPKPQKNCRLKTYIQIYIDTCNGEYIYREKWAGPVFGLLKVFTTVVPNMELLILNVFTKYI